MGITWGSDYAPTHERPHAGARLRKAAARTTRRLTMAALRPAWAIYTRAAGQ